MQILFSKTKTTAAEENCFGEHTAITEKVAQCFEEIFNSVNRNALDDSLTGPSILLNDQQNKAAEALGVIAGVLLAPGFLSSTNGTQSPAFEKPKPRKQNPDSWITQDSAWFE